MKVLIVAFSMLKIGSYLVIKILYELAYKVAFMY